MASISLTDTETDGNDIPITRSATVARGVKVITLIDKLGPPSYRGGYSWFFDEWWKTCTVYERDKPTISSDVIITIRDTWNPNTKVEVAFNEKILPKKAILLLLEHIIEISKGIRVDDDIQWIINDL